MRRGPSPVALLTLGFGALTVATFDSAMGSPDELRRYELALALARHGLSALVGSGSLSRYPPLQSILAAPLMKLGLWLDGGQDGLWTHRLGLSLSLLACVALIPLFYRAARLLDAPVRRATVATLLFGLTSPIWPYSKRFFSEPLTALLALGAFVGVFAYLREGRRRPLWAGLFCLLLMPLNNMALPIAVGAGLVVMLGPRRDRRALAALALAALASIALTVGLQLLRTGTLGDNGYGNEHFTFHTLEGLHGLLFGWGRSLFLFAPLTLLALLGLRPLYRRSSELTWALVTTLILALLIVASWWAWWGGICWGPRLLLPVLPIFSLGFIGFLERPASWKTLATGLVLAAGLYLQGIGCAFKHDFDIYFWMAPDGHDESRAWFDWDHSVITRMPHHFRDHPWDLSSAFLTLQQTGPSTVLLEGRPTREIAITHRGDALYYHWSVSGLYGVLRDGDALVRLPAGQLGATLTPFNGQSGAGALDGDPRTRWESGTKRLDGMGLRLEFPETRHDLVRLELEHMPYATDFPNGLTAKVRADDTAWTPVEAHAATPRRVWNPLIFLFAGLGLALNAWALHRARAAGPDR